MDWNDDPEMTAETVTDALRDAAQEPFEEWGTRYSAEEYEEESGEVPEPETAENGGENESGETGADPI